MNFLSSTRDVLCGMVESSDDASDIRTSKISDINVHDVVTILPYKLCTCQDSAYMYFRQLCHVNVHDVKYYCAMTAVHVKRLHAVQTSMPHICA